MTEKETIQPATMDQPPYSARLDQLSPPCSVTDAIIADNPLSPSLVPTSDRNNAGLYNRLTNIAHRLAHNTAFSSDDAVTLHSHLDHIERLLDPRPALSREIAKCHPVASVNLVSRDGVSPPSAESHSPTPHPQLTVLLHEVTTLNTEIKQRRNESFRLYDTFTHELQGLTRKISQLEGEICQLRSARAEDSAEREALQGTVQGLESWFTAWHHQHGLAVAKMSGDHSRQTRRLWSKRKPNLYSTNETDMEVLLEGMAAWMRGWKDLEEGFRVRESRRLAQREEGYPERSSQEPFPHRIPY